MKRFWLLSAVVLILQGLPGLPVAAGGDICYVDNLAQCAGLAPCYPAIMDAVHAAADSSTIEVFAGVYHEEVVFGGKTGIVLRGHDPALLPIIVAPSGASSAVTVDASPGIQILGFILEAPAAAIVARSLGSMGTVIDGNIIRSPDGIVMQDTGLVIRNNTIEGGGVNADFGGRANLIEGNTIRGDIRIAEFNVKAIDNIVRNNFVQGSIKLSGGSPIGLTGAQGNIVESNLVVDGSIRLLLYRGHDNLIRNNVVRGGGIEVQHGAVQNTIEGNRVSGSPGDGILVNSFGDPGYGNVGGGNTLRGNTSVENAGCDLNDSSNPDASSPNNWLDNRAGTRCGAADDCISPVAWYRDGDADGFGAVDDQQLACVKPVGFVDTPGDCDDHNPSVHPGASEVCDGLDDDCNGTTDEDSAGQPLTASCYSGPAGTAGVGECHAGTATCALGSYGTCVGQVTPTAEICNGLDDNCDGTRDEGFGLPIVVITPTPNVLWPPNHRMATIHVEVAATGGCLAPGATLGAILTSVTSSEMDNAPGSDDGNTIDDIQGASLGSADRDIDLRAERDGRWSCPGSAHTRLS